MVDSIFETLLSVLRDHNVPYDHDALKAAYDDPQSHAAFEGWIQEHLTPETLLTREESASYASLVKNGVTERLETQDLSAVEAFDDGEIRQAIEELKRSTAAIDKQSEALRAQQNAMSLLTQNEKRTREARSNTQREQLRNWDMEKGQISKSVEEISQNLIYQTQDLEQQSKGIESSAKQTVDAILKSDDKLLLSLQKLAAGLEPGGLENEDNFARIQELCARLIKHTVECERTRLDRIYLEALGTSSAATDGHDSDQQEVMDLQDELESLYSEILPVAQMSAEQQFLEPARRILSETDGQNQERTAKAFKYIHECLVYLVDRNEALLARAKEHQSHKMALHFVLESAKQELNSATPQPQEKGPASPVRPNTQRRRKSSTSQPSIKPRTTRRRSSGADLEPEQQLARNLGITLPAETDAEHAQASALERILADRKLKLGIHLDSLQSTTESSIAASLRNARITLQLLQDSLLRDSPYHTIHLVDPELERSVETFGEDVQYVQKSLEEIDLRGLQEKNVHRDQIVERWSR